MTKHDITNLDEIERLETLAYHDRLIWAATKGNPWEGLRFPQTVIYRADVTIADGNVKRMPRLGGRPCFGNPIAWAVHGRIETQVTKRGPQLTRCGKCKARQGCERVSEARLSASEELREADGAFRSAGGRRALRSDRPEAARRALGRLLSTLRDHGPFTSVNDDYARAWPDQRRLQLQEAAAKRKRRQREREAREQLRAGEIPPMLAERLDHERTYRLGLYRSFRATSAAPKAVTVDPTETNDRFTANVWWARERLRLKRTSFTAYAIAKELAAHQLDFGLSHEVLRGRVGVALKRVDLLEQTRRPGSTENVWPLFDAKEALATAVAQTPYENEE